MQYGIPEEYVEEVVAAVPAWLLQPHPAFIRIDRDGLTIVLIIWPSRVLGLPVKIKPVPCLPSFV